MTSLSDSFLCTDEETEEVAETKSCDNGQVMEVVVVDPLSLTVSREKFIETQNHYPSLVKCFKLVENYEFDFYEILLRKWHKSRHDGRR